MRRHAGGVRLSLTAAAAVALALPVPALAASATGPVPVVQPGRILVTPTGGRCTTGFLFRGRNGTVYGTTAGHCSPVDIPSGRSAWPARRGPVVRDAGGAAVGHLVYAVFTPSHNPDLAVFALNGNVRALPGVCAFGGPVALLNVLVTTPTTLQTYGHGEEVSAVSRPRLAAAPRIPRSTHVQATGLALPGDSGSAIETADGRAVGVITDLYVSPTVTAGASATDSAGTVGINRLDVALPAIERAVGTPLRLLTAPVRAVPVDDCPEQ